MLETVDIVAVFAIIFIGMGPLKVMAPFVKATAGLEPAVQRQMARRMVFTAAGIALVLIVFGKLFMELLHISPGALAVAGGIILLLLALGQVMGTGADKGDAGGDGGRDPLSEAIYPLAVPLLLNPIGIVAFVVASAEATTIEAYALVIGFMLIVAAVDLVFFTNIWRIASRLNPSQTLVTEKVFGIFLSALAIEIFLKGLSMIGLITLPGY